jgi:hypothetical protein
MASFKAHISFGILTAAVLSVVLFSFAWVSGVFALLIFVLTIIGSMLPDVDSDTGIPVRILFGVLAVTGLVGSFVYLETMTNFQRGLVSIGIGLCVYFIIGKIFRHFTVHRGIFHSIPAALLMGVISIAIADLFYLEIKTLFSIGLAVTAGYLCHLVLDELNSAVNLSGVPFIPNKSLGTAMQLWSSSLITTLSVYGALLFFVALKYDIFLQVLSNW